MNHLESQHGAHLVKAMLAGSTWVHMKTLEVFIVDYFKNMAMAANEHIGGITLDILSNSGVVARGIAADMGHPKLHAV